MTGPRVLGLAILAGLIALVAVQVPELVRNQRNQPFDRRLGVRSEPDVEALAMRSRSRTVRSRYLVLYWLARELPGATIHVTPGTERQLAPLRGLGDIQVSSWTGPPPLELDRAIAAKLVKRATHRLLLGGQSTLYLLEHPSATEYMLATVSGVPSIVLSREDFAASVKRGPR